MSRRKVITPRPVATSWPPMPPVKPKTSGKLNRRVWNAGRNAEHNKVIAINVGCLKRSRPAEQWRIFERTMRQAARFAKVSEVFPDFDVSAPEAIYYLNYCIQTMECPRSDDDASERWDDRWKAIFYREAAQKVFSAILMGNTTKYVERVRLANLKFHNLVKDEGSILKEEERPGDWVRYTASYDVPSHDIKKGDVVLVERGARIERGSLGAVQFGSEVFIDRIQNTYPHVRVGEHYYHRDDVELIGAVVRIRPESAEDKGPPAHQAIFEAELYARVAAHPDTPPDIRYIINCIMHAACTKLAAWLEKEGPDIDPAFIRDVYPYARMLCPEFTASDAHFRTALQAMEAEMPEVLNEIQTLSLEGKETPEVERPADHPISQLIAEWDGKDDEAWPDEIDDKGVL